MRSFTASQVMEKTISTEAVRDYLHGKFVVTAVSGKRAVMRQLGPDQGRSAARIVVEYPEGILIPQQGTMIDRQEGNGFEIREVTRSQDGQTNIYVRDLAAQQN